jgi:hypothetical protein
LFCFFLLLLLLLLLMRSIDHCPMALQLLAPFFFPPFLFLGCFLFSDGIMRSWLLDAVSTALQVNFRRSLHGE